MANEYWLQFGSGDPRTYTGLAPTFLIFSSWTGGAISPPGITEQIAGSGLYRFEYSPDIPTVFLASGVTTSLSAATKFVTGALDPVQSSAQGITAIGSGITAIAVSLGSTASSFGSTAVDPGTVYGYLKRLLENMEGNAVYAKATGIWSIYSRGSSTLLRDKTLNNNSTSTTKT